MPTWARITQRVPMRTLWATCTRLSILVPGPTTVSPTLPRSIVVLAPTSTSSPSTQRPTWGSRSLPLPEGGDRKPPPPPTAAPAPPTQPRPSRPLAPSVAGGPTAIRPPHHVPRPRRALGCTPHAGRGGGYSAASTACSARCASGTTMRVAGPAVRGRNCGVVSTAPAPGPRKEGGGGGG